MNIRTQKHFLDPNPDKKELNIENHLGQIMEKSAKLSQELNINDALSCCNLYSYLLFDGVFSQKRIFQLEERGSNYYPENIVLGKGDSFAISDMLEMFLTKREFENYSLTALLDYSDINVNYEPKITKCRMTYPAIQDALYHHSVNLIVDKEKNNHFVYDASSGLLLKVKNSKKLELINGKGNMLLSYPVSNIFDSGSFDMGRTPEFLKNISKKESPSRDLFIKTFEDDIKTFKQNQNLTKDFRDDIEENIIEICKSMRK